MKASDMRLNKIDVSHYFKYSSEFLPEKYKSECHWKRLVQDPTCLPLVYKNITLINSRQCLSVILMPVTRSVLLIFTEICYRLKFHHLTHSGARVASTSLSWCLWAGYHSDNISDLRSGGADFKSKQCWLRVFESFLTVLPRKLRVIL